MDPQPKGSERSYSGRIIRRLRAGNPARLGTRPYAAEQGEIREESPLIRGSGGAEAGRDRR